MAETRESDELFWLDPDQRGILPLDAMHLPRRLRRTVRAGRFEVTADRDFEGVIDGCAAASGERQDTWINPRIRELFVQLHRMGHAHSIECWRNGQLMGGLYGLAIGGAFFGESMFSRESDASKVALVQLVARLVYGGFTLLDTQFITDHLEQFGTIEIDRKAYRRALDTALARPCVFPVHLPPAALSSFLDSTGGSARDAAIDTSPDAAPDAG